MSEGEQALVEQNHELIYAFLYKYHLPVEDYYGIAAIGLCNAAIYYKQELSNFSTFAWKCMYNAYLHEKKKESRLKDCINYNTISYDSKVSLNEDVLSTVGDTLVSEDVTEDDILYSHMFKQFFSGLSHRDKRIIYLAYCGYNLTDIGRILGCSRSGVGKIKKKIKKEVKLHC